MIIDCHTHIFPQGWPARREALAAADPLFARMYGDPRARMATAAELVASMDGAGIDAAAICGFAWTDPALCRDHNDALLAAARAAPGRLLPFAAVSLTDPSAAEAEARRCQALGALGIGELRPAAHGLDLDEPAAGDALASVAGTLPLLIHVSEPVGHDYAGKEGQPIGPLFRFLQHHPETSVIMAHLGGGLPFYAYMPEVRRALASTFVDLAAWPLLYDDTALAQVVSLMGADRVLFATDFPLRRQDRDLARARAALPDGVLAGVLGANATRLFRLEG